MGITSRTVWIWARLVETRGWEALADQPHYKAMPDAVRRRVVEVYQEHPEWTFAQIAREVQPLRWPGNEHRFHPANVRLVLEEAGLVDPWADYRWRGGQGERMVSTSDIVESNGGEPCIDC